MYASGFSLDGEYKKVTLIHSRSEIVQIELRNSFCLIGSRDSLILCSTKNKDLTVLVDLPSFAPSITGSCFTTGNNAAFCDESGNGRTFSLFFWFQECVFNKRGNVVRQRKNRYLFHHFNKNLF